MAQLPAEPITGREWLTTPIASNYDPCADLSTILVTVQGATGSSPVQALMFHRGEYLGTGTSKAYGFTDLDIGSSTNDTVVLTYKTGQTCNACNDGTRTPVEFHWDGTSVRMLGAPPN
ncbi:LppP/LprE family lipoprotein [Rhodococcus erythropolis]|uniref:LppP/LprE family lipoprotein n=1 Tax=Rhodococcus TaxID=1827 RepID=UPI0010DBC768|nr:MULTISPECIES: LppP/LprE family lipoprotein [Rhodococcus]MDV6208093.1 LppP/LprE family lipoprotein [Rhodococcus erythropolis]